MYIDRVLGNERYTLREGDTKGVNVLKVAEGDPEWEEGVEKDKVFMEENIQEKPYE